MITDDPGPLERSGKDGRYRIPGAESGCDVALNRSNPKTNYRRAGRHDALLRPTLTLPPFIPLCQVTGLEQL
jgi:hypothetical protein